MHYIGLMSGTSADAIDAVLVAVPANGPLKLLASHSHPILELTKKRFIRWPGPDRMKSTGWGRYTPSSASCFPPQRWRFCVPGN